MKLNKISLIYLNFLNLFKIDYLITSKKIQNRLFLLIELIIFKSEVVLLKKIAVIFLTKNLFKENPKINNLTKLILNELMFKNNVKSLCKSLNLNLDSLQTIGNINKVFLISKILQRFGNFNLAVMFENNIILNIDSLESYNLNQAIHFINIKLYYEPSKCLEAYETYPELKYITPYKQIETISKNLLNHKNQQSKVLICGPFIESFKYVDDDFDRFYFIRITKNQYYQLKSSLININNKYVYYSNELEFKHQFGDLPPFDKDNLIYSDKSCNNKLIGECFENNLQYLLINGFPQAVQRLVLHNLYSNNTREICVIGANFYINQSYPKNYGSPESYNYQKNAWHSLISNYRLINILFDNGIVTTDSSLEHLFKYSLNELAQIYNAKISKA